MSDIFEHRIRTGRRFAYSQRTLTFLVNFVTIAFVARLVPPAQFGLMAMITSVVNFLAVFRDLGLTSATIQRASLSDGRARIALHLQRRGNNYYFHIVGAISSADRPILSRAVPGAPCTGDDRRFSHCGCWRSTRLCVEEKFRLSPGVSCRGRRPRCWFHRHNNACLLAA